MKPLQMWGCVPHEPKRGLIDWKTKLVLDWQVDNDGYRIEPRKGRHKLYVVANGGELRRYTAHAWQEDIIFELANIAAPPFPRSKWEEERASDNWSYDPFSTIADEVVAAPDGVVIERVLAFAKQWGLLGQSHVEQPLSDILVKAVGVRECFEREEDGRLFIIPAQRVSSCNSTTR